MALRLTFRRVESSGSSELVVERNVDLCVTFIMNTRRRKFWFAALFTLCGGLLWLQFLGRPIAITFLRAHATVYRVDAPPGGRFGVVMFRYPRLRHLPEILGLGEGYLQLYEIGTGRVLQEKTAEELSAIRMSAWSSSSVSLQGFVEWPLPKWW